MPILKTIVVDDHEPAVEQLVQAISNTCPQVEIVDHFPVAPDSLYKIDKASPDLIFFDAGGIEYSGLEILSDWESTGGFQFILTDTNILPYNMEFTVSITDYLTKPICPKQLTKAIERVIDRRPIISFRKEMLQMARRFQTQVQPKIAIPTMRGLDMLDFRHILFVEAADNYSILHLEGGNQILCSQNLARMEERLHYFPFTRIHRKYLVNLVHVISYIKGDGGQVILSNKASLSVSRKKKDDLLTKLNDYF